MELLPELRMAFAYFTPREIDRIASMAAGLHGKGGRDILERKEVYPDWYSYGKAVDDYVKGRMGRKANNLSEGRALWRTSRKS